MTDEVIRTRLTLPKHLVEVIDQLVGRSNRNAFIIEAAMEKLQRERLGRAFAEPAGFLPKGAYLEWETPEAVSAWVRKQRDLAKDNR